MRDAAVVLVWLVAVAVLIRAILKQCDEAAAREAEIERRRRNWSP